MANTHTLTIPVRIIACHAHTLTIRPQDPQESCPKCARGEGCGARPWFRGLFKNRADLHLPRDPHPWQNGDRATLHLPAAILNRATALTYGIPLLTFLLALTLTQTLAPAAQLALSLALAAASHLPARRYSEHLLITHLHLSPETANHCPVKAPLQP